MKKMMLLLCNLAAGIYAWDIIANPEHAKNIRNYLSLKLGPEDQWAQYPDLIKEFANDALKPYGYMSSSISLNLPQHTVHVDPGPATTFNNISIKLSPDCVGIHPQATPLNGFTFRNDRYIALKDDLLNQAYNLGYFDASISGAVLIQNRHADVDLKLTCHQRYLLKDVIVDSPFKSDLYVRHAEKNLHKPAGTTNFIEFTEAIRARPELGQHEITEIKNETDHTISWQVTNRRAPDDHRSIGAGFISGRGFDLMLKYSRIRQPAAHYISMLSHLSTQSIDGQWVYSIPSRMFLDGTHSFRAFHEIFPNKRFNQVSSSELSYRLIRQNIGLKTEYGLSFQYNRDQPDDVIVASHAFYPYLQQQIDWDHPLSHTRLTWLSKGTIRTFGSQFNFISVDVNVHHRHQLPANVLAKMNVQLAGIVHGANLQDSWRYRTGGPTTVMGHSVDSIGPGNYLTLGRMGFFYPLTSSWYLGYWFSTGSAASAPFKELATGHAIAADMQTPMGAIEFAISKAPDHNLQFSLTLLPL